MKALSFWQPHGSLLTTGAKPYETRNRRTKVRGEILLHASVRFVRGEWNYYMAHPEYRQGLAPLLGLPLDFTVPAYFIIPKDFVPMGAFIGIGELIDCIPTEQMTPEQHLRARGFGDFSPGRFAWEFANVRRFKTPIPAKGHQGFWYDHISPEQMEFA